MDIFEFIPAILNALAWPMAVVLITIIFRKPFIDLIARITRISHNQTQIDIAPLVESNDAAEIAGSLSAENASAANPAHDSIASSPRSAIIEAWITVESAAFEALSFKGIPPDRRTRARIIPLLRQQGLIDPALEPVLHDLLRTRNEAAHQWNLGISPEAARLYVEIVDRVATTIKPKMS